MNNIMLDLETMGTGYNSAIIAIGAVKFDINNGITDKFYKVVDLNSCIKKGFDIDADNVYWWLRQSDQAKGELSKNLIHIKDALIQFKGWIGKGNLQIWGNGSDFDNVILTNAFRKYGVTSPWPHYSNRCYRTIRYSYPSLEIPNVGISHKAIDDAEYQANYLIILVKKYKLTNIL